MKEYKYTINGMKFTVAVGDIIDNEARVEVNGVPYKVELEKKKVQKPALSQSGHTNHGPVTAPTTKPTPQPSKSIAGAIKSPLPGTIISINVNVGDKIKIGDKVGVLEAMKMENELRSTLEGTVTQILAKVGDTVLEGTDLIVIE